MQNTNRKAHFPGRHSMLFQMTVLFVTLTVIATALTGWLIYNRAASQLLDNAWTLNETLLKTALASINRQFLQARSFAWQLSNSDKVISAMYVREQTPDSILNTRDIIATLQGMKAFMDTAADIGIHLYNSNAVITAESSYDAGKYYAKFGPETGMDIASLLETYAGRSVLCAYAGRHTVTRLISKEDVLTFVSGLPIGGNSLFGYSFINLKVEKLRELLPQSEDSFLVLADDAMQPLYATGGTGDMHLFLGICGQIKTMGGVRTVRYEGADYGVLTGDTDVPGLCLIAVVPYRALLKQADGIRLTTMVVICGCMLLGLFLSAWMSRRMYAPLALLTKSLKQLSSAGNAEGKRAQNEIAFIGEVVKAITLENKELTLNNRQVNRLLKSRLLAELMEGRLKDNDQARRALADAGIQLPHTQVQVAVFDFNLGEHGLQELEKRLEADLGDWAEQQMARLPHGGLTVYAAGRPDQKLLVLFNIDARHSHPEIIYDLLAELRQSLETAYGASVRIGVGRAYVKGTAGCANSLIDALLALREDMPGGAEAILLAEETEACLEPLPHYSLSEEQQLINQAKSGQKELVAEQLKRLCGQGGDLGPLQESTAHALLYTARRIASLGGAEDIFLESLAREGIPAREVPGSAPTLDGLQNVFFAVIDGLQQNRTTQDHQLYGRMLDFIRRQYAHDISLSQLSDYMQLSPSYVGLIFRRVGGTSFGKYVSDYRIEKAKELLLENHLTVKQVGERVGIENQNTFIRVFKKIEGVTPGQYREAKTATHAPN